jgi:muramoyltetrapeptide carboxypeptidase
MRTVFPAALKPGDTIGIVAPASGVADQEHWSAATKEIERAGYNVRLAQHTRSVAGYISASDADRREDLEEVFRDPNVQGILCAKGGYGSLRLLDQLDFTALTATPKVFVGFSDITALLLGLYAKTGLCTFHGPMPAYNFAIPDFPRYNSERFWQIVQGVKVPYSLENPLKSSYQTIYGGKAQGKLVGGNLTVLSHLVGTPYLPTLKDAILFLEDVDEEPYRIERCLVHLRLAGLLQGIAGIVLGEFIDCLPKRPDRPSPTLLDVFTSMLTPLRVPIGYGFPFAHGRYVATFPIGIKCEFNADNGLLTFLEPGVIA